MSDDIFTKIYQSQHKNSESTLQLIHQFEPLIKSYSFKLGYEDAYPDMVLFFIQMINEMDLNKFKVKEDKVFIHYFKIAIKNKYLKKKSELYQEYIKIADYIDDTDLAQKVFIEDEYSKLLFDDLENILNKIHYEIIYLIYYQKYSVEEIAQMKNVSRQYINKKKNEALNILEKKLL